MLYIKGPKLTGQKQVGGNKDYRERRKNIVIIIIKIIRKDITTMKQEQDTALKKNIQKIRKEVLENNNKVV